MACALTPTVTSPSRSLYGAWTFFFYQLFCFVFRITFCRFVYLLCENLSISFSALLLHQRPVASRSPGSLPVFLTAREVHTRIRCRTLYIATIMQSTKSLCSAFSFRISVIFKLEKLFVVCLKYLVAQHYYFLFCLAQSTLHSRRGLKMNWNCFDYYMPAQHTCVAAACSAAARLLHFSYRQMRKLVSLFSTPFCCASARFQMRSTKVILRELWFPAAAVPAKNTNRLPSPFTCRIGQHKRK